MSPSEVDSPQDVANGTVYGAKHAAIRKLDHELGIPASQVPLEKFKFLTRLHYWAADTVTHGPKRYVHVHFFEIYDYSTTQLSFSLVTRTCACW